MRNFRKSLRVFFALSLLLSGTLAWAAEDAIRLPLKVGTILLYKPFKVRISGLLTLREELGRSSTPTVMTIEDSKAGQLNVKYPAAVKYIKNNPVNEYSTEMMPPVLEIPSGPVQIYDQYLQAEELTGSSAAVSLLNQVLREKIEKEK